MSNPVICNQSPAPGETGSVDSGARFSLRVESGIIDRSSLRFHLGAGPAFYPGSILPRDHETIRFNLETKFFNYHDPAIVSLDGGTGELIIEKLTPAQVQAATYFFGGLQSPAIPEAQLMLEFTLRLQDADVDDITIDAADDQHQLAGPECGFLIGNTGVTVRFLRDSPAPGGNRWVELHDGRLTAPAAFPPLAEPILRHDWDQSQAWTYKVLWDTRLDLVRLYVSTGGSTVADLLLVEAAISSITPVPDDELRPNLPVAFFGHGHGDPTSTSRWGNAYLYNIVSTPVMGGIFLGEHTGILRSDDVVHYRGDTLPNKAFQAWNLVPSSLGTISGREFLTGDKLVLAKSGAGKIYGYHRIEPTLDTEPLVLDFELTGLYNYLDSASDNTGVEVFIDDGTKLVRINLLYSSATQYIGILIGGRPPTLATSYMATLLSWSTERSYRVIFQPGVSVRLVTLELDDDELVETVLAELGYTQLPDTRDSPGDWTPSLGFIVNGTDSAEHDVSMQLGRVRYSTNVRLVEGSTVPISPWTEVGTGSTTTDGSELNIVNDSDSAVYNLERGESLLSSIGGVTMEFKMRIDSYELDGETDPIRSLTGVGINIDDGTYYTILTFAEGGPDLGKIMFLATMSDLEDNLLAIRAEDDDVEGTYTQVDWTESKIYRIEKTDGVGINVYVADSPVAVISIAAKDVPLILPPTDGVPGVSFGSLVEGTKNSSYWTYLRYSVAAGIEVAAFPVLSQNEVLARFDHAINVIVELEDLLSEEFVGTPAEFSGGGYYEPYDPIYWVAWAMFSVPTGTAYEPPPNVEEFLGLPDDLDPPTDWEPAWFWSSDEWTQNAPHPVPSNIEGDDDDAEIGEFYWHEKRPGDYLVFLAEEEE